MSSMLYAISSIESLPIVWRSAVLSSFCTALVIWFATSTNVT